MRKKRKEKVNSSLFGNLITKDYNSKWMWLFYLSFDFLVLEGKIAKAIIEKLKVKSEG